MKKRRFIFLSLCLVTGIILLLIMNYRYPFYSPKVGNWSVGYQTSDNVFPQKKLKPAGIITYELVDTLIAGRIDYIADPFFINDKEQFYLFVEVKGQDNADIALFTSLDGKSYGFGGIVLDESFHLSYPQVFKYKDEFYMLPETKGSNNILLYRAQNFPYEWEISDTLIKNKGLKDPTILLSDELNLMVTVDDNLKQYIFEADSLHGEWKEVKEYEQRWGNETRPGGRFFNVSNQWYLPLQNRSKGYGTGISIFKLELNNGKIKFIPQEKLFLEPQPDIIWFNRGMHHLDIQEIDSGYYLVYDGDRNTGESEFQYKRTIKFNLIDLYNLLTQ